MPKISFSPLVVETSERIYGLSALVELIYRSTPEIEFRDREALKDLAENEGWDYGDYQVEGQMLDVKFQYWLPRLSAYSVLILLSSVVETQLLLFAKDRATLVAAGFDAKEFGSDVLKRAAAYIRRVTDSKLDVTRNRYWQPLDDLQFLRNIVVHRAGRPRSDERQRTEKLCKKYRGLSLEENRYSFSRESELHLTIHACRHFVAQAEGFFRDVFAKCNLPPYGGLWPNIESTTHRTTDKND